MQPHIKRGEPERVISLSLPLRPFSNHTQGHAIAETGLGEVEAARSAAMLFGRESNESKWQPERLRKDASLIRMEWSSWRGEEWLRGGQAIILIVFCVCSILCVRLKFDCGLNICKFLELRRAVG